MVRHLLIDFKNKHYILQLQTLYDLDNLKLKISIYEIMTRSESLIKILKDSLKINCKNEDILNSINNSHKLSNILDFESCVEIFSYLEESNRNNDYNIDYLLKVKSGKNLELNLSKTNFLMIYNIFKVIVNKYEDLVLANKKEILNNSTTNNVINNDDINLDIEAETLKYIDNTMMFWVFDKCKRNLHKLKLDGNTLEYDTLINLELMSVSHMAKDEFVKFLLNYHRDNYVNDMRNIARILRKMVNDLKVCKDVNYDFYFGILIFALFIHYIKQKYNKTKYNYIDFKKQYQNIITGLFNSKIDSNINLQFKYGNTLITNLDSLKEKYDYLKFIDFDEYIKNITSEYSELIADFPNIRFNNPEFLRISKNYNFDKYKNFTDNKIDNDSMIVRMFKDINEKLFPLLYKDKSVYLFDFLYVYKKHIKNSFKNISITEIKELYYYYIIPYLYENKKITTFKVYI